MIKPENESVKTVFLILTNQNQFFQFIQIVGQSLISSNQEYTEKILME